MGYLTIKIVRVGSANVEATVANNSTVRQALEAGGVSVDENSQIRFDGQNVSMGSALTQSGTLFISKPIAGA